MAETRYQDLSDADRRDVLKVVENASVHKAHLLEKDIWVVAALGALFDTRFGEHLTFKGGTSLSKVWRAIRRFSEDVDVTYNIRSFAPDLVAGSDEEALPPTRSQEKRWTRAIRVRLAAWVRSEALPIVQEALARTGFLGRVRADGDRLFIGYEPLFEETDFVRPEVKLEFGARSTGEPNASRTIICDAAPYLPSLIFPEAIAAVMLAERTFWEKATAVHVYCRQQRRRGERLSRHWHDLARLDEAGIAANALADRKLALSVARHKAVFFSENDAIGQRIDYEAAVSGGLQLVPSGTAHEVLADDYTRMRADGMLLDESEPFDVLMERCAAIEARANASQPSEA